ncbi:MAG: hypothetical protein NZM16_00120, partial [Thermoflexus sp.]|uniref:hypothetical protein n=1 Tax=Thermoflexus sp. TaxID=1969742 RepID=UPI0025DD7957
CPLAAVATVRWRTTQLADGRFWYGQSCGSWERTIVRAERVTEHSVGIPWLQPNTYCCYEAHSVNARGASER